MPPSLREWLPDEHLAWFVLDAVEEMNLDAFYAAYRADGWGRAAHDPAMMVALLLWSSVRLASVADADKRRGAVASAARASDGGTTRVPGVDATDDEMARLEAAVRGDDR